MPEPFEPLEEVDELDVMKRRRPMELGVVKPARMTSLEASDQREISAPSFRGGQVAWSPSSNVPSVEQVLDHRLGRVPVGLFLVCQRRALNWYVTPEQKSRWTKERIYFSVAQHAHHESGVATLVAGIADVTLVTSIEKSNYLILLTSKEASPFDHPPLKVDRVNDDPDDSQRFISFRVNFADEMTGSNVIFSWAAYGAVRADDSYVWQVI